jgi:hypothetical protein
MFIASKGKSLQLGLDCDQVLSPLANLLAETFHAGRMAFVQVRTSIEWGLPFARVHVFG